MGGFGTEVVSGTQTNGTDVIGTVFALGSEAVTLWEPNEGWCRPKARGKGEGR